MKCSIEDCNNPSRAKGYCAIHYARIKRNGTHNLSQWSQAKCKQDGCEIITASSSGYCVTHYKQQHYLRGIGRDKLLERTSQERWINVQTGYIMMKHNGKLTYEHIVLAEKALGKSLPRGAIVHHMAQKDDNHGFCKLVVCPSQEYHFLLHKRMRELGYENN